MLFKTMACWIFWLFLQTPLSAYHFEPFDESNTPECQAERCLSMDEVVERSKYKAFASRLEFNNLYQFHQKVKENMGNLFPSLNFWSVLSAAILDPSAIFQVSGFLMPSKWFTWKESKINYLAQRYAAIDLVANQALMGQSIFTSLHREIINVEIYKHYFRVLDALFADIKRSPTHHGLNEGDLAILEALRNDMSANYLFIQDKVADLIPKLGLQLDLDRNEDWEEMSLVKLELKDLSNTPALVPEDYIDEAYEKSDQLKALQHMVHAAKYNIRARYFDWMSPTGSTSLGLGLKGHIRLGKAQRAQIEIKIEELKSRIKYDVYGAIGVYNTALLGFKESMQGRESVSKIMNFVAKQIEKGEKINVHQIYEGVQLGVDFDILRNFAQHLYLAMDAQIHRLHKKGPYYQDIETKVPDYRHNYRLPFYKRMENKRIERALRLGKIDLSIEDQDLVNTEPE